MDDGRWLTAISFLLHVSDFYFLDAEARNIAWGVLSMHTEHLWCHTLHPYGLGRRNSWMAPGLHHSLHVLLLCQFRLSSSSLIVIRIIALPVISVSAGIN